MSTTLILIHMIGAVCLLLWATRMVRQGFTLTYGTKLRHIIAAGTKNRFKSFLSGMGVTMLLQSSTATTLMTASFIKKGLVSTAAGLAIVIGADIATTLVAQILTFDLSALSPILIIAGVAARSQKERRPKFSQLARIFVGLGLMLLSLSLIREISAPFAHSEILPIILTPLQSEPFLAIAIAALLTWLLHSSLAAVLLFASLASNNIISLDLGLELILGANLGGALIPYAATYVDGPKVRRITGANMVMRAITLLLCLPLLEVIANQLSVISGVQRQLVTFHTGFNIALAILFLPFTGIIAAQATKLMPAKKRKNESAPLFLDEKSLDAPTIALASAARETLRLADLLSTMLAQTFQALEESNEILMRRTRKTDHQIDAIYKEIKSYLTRVKHEDLTAQESQRFEQIIAFSTNLEHCGDIIDKSLIALVEKKIQKHENFSEKGWNEISEFYNEVVKNIQTAGAVFISQSTGLASELIDKKKTLRQAELASSQAHFQRLREGQPQTIATSSLHLDILRDLRRINSYVTNVAYNVLDTSENPDK